MDVLRYIPSPDVREAVQGYPFTALEQAFIIYHSFLPLDKKVVLLNQLQRECADEQERICVERNAAYLSYMLRPFTQHENGEGLLFYVTYRSVILRDADTGRPLCFGTAQEAVQSTRVLLKENKTTPYGEMTRFADRNFALDKPNCLAIKVYTPEYSGDDSYSVDKSGKIYACEAGFSSRGSAFIKDDAGQCEGACGIPFADWLENRKASLPAIPFPAGTVAAQEDAVGNVRYLVVVGSEDQEQIHCLYWSEEYNTPHLRNCTLSGGVLLHISSINEKDRKSKAYQRVCDVLDCASRTITADTPAKQANALFRLGLAINKMNGH